MAIWHDRLNERMTALGYKWNALADYVGVSTAATTQWKKGHSQELKGQNLLKTAKFLNVSPDWLMGKSPVQARVSNMNLVKDEPGDLDVLIPQYKEIQLAAGQGVANPDDVNPCDYMTFKKSWLKCKGLQAESLVVVYAKGNSMAERVQDGDAVLINTAYNQLVDDCIYAFSYGGLARLKRIRIRANGNITLVSDNDPNGSQSETLQPETMDELVIIGQAVWVGGSLN